MSCSITKDIEDLNCESCSKENCSKKKVFERVKVVSNLELILKERLPLSASLYNIYKIHSKWSKEVKLYTFGEKVLSESWIVATHQRNDGVGMEISVSRPPKSDITDEIREAFSKASFIDWSKSFVFESVDTEVSTMVTDISIRDKGNYTHVHPCQLYYMEVEDALRLTDRFDYEEGVEIKSIDNPKGEEFILSTGKYTSKTSDTYVKTVLSRNPSTGVYVNGEIVAGVTLTANGLTSMLNTSAKHQGKGYAQSAVHLQLKRLAKEGIVPAATADLRNESLKAFHTKIGFKVAAFVDKIIYQKPTF